MKDRESVVAGFDIREDYVKRLIKSFNYKGNSDHEDPWSILWDFQGEIIKELTNRVVERLENLKDHEQEMHSFDVVHGIEQAIRIVKDGIE